MDNLVIKHAIKTPLYRDEDKNKFYRAECICEWHGKLRIHKMHATKEGNRHLDKEIKSNEN